MSERELDGIDAPRALPPALRDRIEASLLTGRPAIADDPAAPGLDDELGSPRPMPPHLRQRIERELTARRALRTRVLAAAAAIVMIVAGGTLVVRERTAPGGTQAPLALDAVPRPGFGGGTAPPSRRDPGGAPPGPVEIDEPGQPSGATPSLRTAPPPYAFGDSAARTDLGPDGSQIVPAPAAGADRGGSDPKPPPPPPVAGDPIAVRMEGGKGPIADGFRAYVEVLNETGGINGRPMILTGGREGIATVNLGPVPVKPRSGPLFETIAAPERLLRGDVFGFAGPPERQAHLIAGAVFPADDPGSRAVIYHAGGGAFDAEIPDAIEEVLAARDVAVVRVSLDDLGSISYLPADAVFLSMPADRAERWLLTRPPSYAPVRGIAGVWSLADHDLVASMPDGTRVLSPYSFGAGSGEAAEIERRTGRALSAEVLHGWVTAKSIAVAIWRDEPSGPDALTRAIEGLDGYANGFAPRYRTRAGTNARTPEGIVYEVRNGTFVAVSSFLRDRF